MSTPRPSRPGFNPFGWPAVARYALAPVAVAVAVWLRFEFAGLLPVRAFPFILFFPAVLLVAYAGGVWPGVLAAVLSVFASWHFFMRPGFALEPITDTDALALLIFGAVLVINVAMLHALHTALARARRAEQAVRRREQRVRSVIDNMYVYAGLLDPDGTVREVNRSPLQVSGLAREDVLGKPLWESFWWSQDPEARDRLREAIRRAAGGETVRYDTEVLDTPGHRQAIDLQIAPMRDASGGVASLVVNAVDVTARLAAMTALEQSEEKFRALADHIPQLAWMGDAQGQRYWFNRRWLEYSGTTAGQMAGEGWTMVHHPDHVERVTRGFERSMRTGVPFEDTFPLRRHDGEYRWFLTRALPLRGADGTVLRWFGTSTDITDQLMAERALRETQAGLLAREAALRHADHQKDVFLATLAHELRNPLAPIRSASHIIGMRPGTDDQVRRAAAIIERQSAQLTRLVEDLLDLSRITAGNLQLRQAPLDLRRVIEGAVETCQPLLDAERHACVVRIPAEPLMVRGDEVRLVQCVVNLVQNAIKFTPAPGHITVEAGVPREGWAEVRVTDNGQGIGADLLPRVFELFVQERHSGMAGNSGLGIGLALTRHLVELHGGHVTARSDGPGKGAEFALELPLVAAARPVAPEPGIDTTPARAAGTASVLVVDDNADAAALLKELFDIEGYPTSLALDGASALETARRERPAIVVLDIGLPDLSGYDVARALRGDPSLPQPLLIALTGWGDEHARAQARAAGFDHHLTKPADFAQLLQVIQDHCAAIAA